MPTIIEIRPYRGGLAVFWRATRWAVLDWRECERGCDWLRQSSREIWPRGDSGAQSERVDWSRHCIRGERPEAL